MAKGKRGRPKKGCDKKSLMESVVEPNVDIEEDNDFIEEDDESLDDELDFENHTHFGSEFYSNDDEL